MYVDIDIVIRPCENISNGYLTVDGQVAISGASYKASKIWRAFSIIRLKDGGSRGSH